MNEMNKKLKNVKSPLRSTKKEELSSTLETKTPRRQGINSTGKKCSAQKKGKLSLQQNSPALNKSIDGRRNSDEIQDQLNLSQKVIKRKKLNLSKSSSPKNGVIKEKKSLSENKNHEINKNKIKPKKKKKDIIAVNMDSSEGDESNDWDISEFGKNEEVENGRSDGNDSDNCDEMGNELLDGSNSLKNSPTEGNEQIDYNMLGSAEDVADVMTNKDDDGEEDEMDLSGFVKPQRKRKKGLIYISNLPKHMNVTRIREYLGEYGEIGRVYLQPERVPLTANGKKKKRKPFARHFTEGWVEFESKRVAKKIVPLLNNTQISARKKSQFYDSYWCMKYLPGFKWVHLTERMNYERELYKHRLRAEVSQARKEANFFQSNLDKSEYLKKKAKRLAKKEKVEECGRT